RNLQFHNDRVFGQAVYTSWDIFKLTGLDRPPGTRWNLDLNYLSLRGPQIGMNGSYRGTSRFGLDGPYQGQGYSSFIYDSYHDNLGQDRLNLTPAHHARGGIEVRDRTDLPYGMVLQSELGYLSDRNWLEQYREKEFDTGKDYETLLYLRQNIDQWGWSVTGRPRLYNEFNATQWLPRGDLFGLAEPLFGGLLTWSSHTYAGYAPPRTPDPPPDPQALSRGLPLEAALGGMVASTRHELALPFQIGPLHFVPYALGEETFWGSASHNINNTTPIEGRVFGSTQV